MCGRVLSGSRFVRVQFHEERTKRGIKVDVGCSEMIQKLPPPPSFTPILKADCPAQQPRAKDTKSDAQKRSRSVSPRQSRVMRSTLQTLGRLQSETRLGRWRSKGVGDSWPSTVGTEAYREDWPEAGWGRRSYRAFIWGWATWLVVSVIDRLRAHTSQRP